MKKLDLSYILWKLLMGLLLLLMTLIVSVPVYYLISTGDFSVYAATRAAAVSSFVAYLVFQYSFLLRADVSHYSFRSYYLGEVIVSALTTAISAGVLAAVSGGNTPTEFSYVSFFFLPHNAAAYLFSNILAGAAAQTVLCALLFPALWYLKKKKDPALTGSKNKAIVVEPEKKPEETPDAADDGETAEDEEDGKGAPDDRS